MSYGNEVNRAFDGSSHIIISAETPISQMAIQDFHWFFQLGYASIY
jgi:hypothetical protein